MRWHLDGRVIREIVVFFAIILGSLVAAFWIGDHFTNSSFIDRSGPMAADTGDYLNYAIGAPVALAGSIVAAWIAASTRSVGERQERLDTLRFVTDRLTRFGKVWGRASGLIAAMTEQSRRFFRLAGEYWRRVDAAAEAGSQDQPGEDADAEKGLQALEESLEAKLVDFQTDCISFADLFRFKAVSDPFNFSVMRRTAERVRGGALHYLNAHHPTGFPLVTSDPRMMADIIAFLAPLTECDEMLDVYRLLPVQTATLEMIGAALWVIDEQGRLAHGDVNTDEGRTPLCYNVGMALLVDLYQFIPSKEAMRAFLNEEFPNFASSRRGHGFLVNDAQVRENMFSDEKKKVFDRFIKEPWRFVYVGSRGNAGSKITYRHVEDQKELDGLLAAARPVDKARGGRTTVPEVWVGARKQMFGAAGRAALPGTKPNWRAEELEVLVRQGRPARR